MMQPIRLFGLAMLYAILPPSSTWAGTVYVADLSGLSESPPNASPGIGFARVELDTVAHTLRVEVSFSGLIGTTTVAHIHAATTDPLTGLAGVATQTPTFSGFPTGVTSGSYDQTFDTSLDSTWNAPFITANGGTALGAEAALAAALAAGKAYLNIHTGVFPGGEIRGFLVAVPEPPSLFLGGSAMGIGLLKVVRRKRRADATRDA